MRGESHFWATCVQMVNIRMRFKIFVAGRDIWNKVVNCHRMQGVDFLSTSWDTALGFLKKTNIPQIALNPAIGHELAAHSDLEGGGITEWP